MDEKLQQIKIQLQEDYQIVNNLEQLNDWKVKYLGKKGLITEISSMMRDIPNEQKKEVGQKIQEVRSTFQQLYEEKKKNLEDELLNEKLASDAVDITLDGVNIKPVTGAHMVEKVIEDLESLFISMGYTVEEGPEVEKDLYNFEMLNLPKGHPARDAQDTFYIDKDEILLRSQTSPVQVRTMLKNKEKGPIRIICPGKTYRRDDDDATHSHQFTQMEGLVIDKEISLADLKGTFDVVAKHLFGSDRLTRFRPSFYPFTEPSVELDISCFNCGMKGCPICKGTGWITVGGAGIVHPNVLKSSGYDPDKVSGFAFGFGIERLTMLKYGITDIRVLYTNDLRSNTQFSRRDV